MVVAFAALSISGCSNASPTTPATKSAEDLSGRILPAHQGKLVRLVTAAGQTTLCVIVADTPADRAAGLMGVEALAPYDAMLFIFDDALQHQFWMWHTPQPLELLPIRDGMLAAPISMAPCRRDRSVSCPRYRPDFEYSAALEAPPGLLADRGLDPASDAVRLVRSDEWCG